MTIDVPGTQGVLVGPITQQGHVQTRTLRICSRDRIIEITLTGDNTNLKFVTTMPSDEDFAPSPFA